ncbi:MAG: hypothetical protein P1P88_03875 [Bacteroidales bacterium]|nr:hypothetical protein [Bacteroidales bacterium]
MKKSNLIIVMLVAFGAIFTSCKKELDNSAVVIDLEKKAQITIVVRNEPDLTLAETTYSAIPAGSKVTLTINNSYFNANATGVWSQTFDTDASGQVIAEIPTTINGITLGVQVQAFQGTQKQYDINLDPVTLKGYYSHSGTTLGLKVNDDKVLEINNLVFVPANN